MCGIAGILANKNLASSSIQEVAVRMANAMQHRGPDDSGVWVDSINGVAFSHRRLSIQDISSNGKQPMRSSSGRYLITYNGEIYNFHNIANKLRTQGWKFRGHSDTEVILAAIEEWGLDNALQQFTGMFAFALWDCSTQLLYLTRDRIGEKPLYYGFINNNFIFASELKALSKHPDWAPGINTDALSSYMRFGYVPTPYSIYNGIYKLYPGSILEIDANAMKLHDNISPISIANLPQFMRMRSYWSFKETASQDLSKYDISDSVTIDRLDDLLHQTIKQQMISDVPIGAFLSGGIDSSTVASIMQSESNRPISTFTIGFSEKDYNEAEFAKQISSHLGTSHTELYISPSDAMRVVPDLSTMYDEPFADSSQIPAYLISKLAKNNVTVCLSGDGGDELFAGYNRYIWTENIWRKFRSFPSGIKNLFANLLELVPPDYWDRLFFLVQHILHSKAPQKSVGIKLHKLAQLLRTNSLFDVYYSLLSYWGQPDLLVLNSTETLSSIRNDNIPDNCHDFISKAMFWDSISYLPDDNLAKVDRASMSVSLETRLPLLDHKIVEFAWSIPLSMKVRNSTSKWILREVLYRYVPRKLIERPKMGFSVPIGYWIRGPLRDWAEDLLDANRLSSQGFLNTSLVRQRWQEHLSGRRNWQLSLWAILMFQAWLENTKEINA